MQPENSPRPTQLLRTPLNAVHRKLGAKMVDFGGWDMPVEYPSSGGLIAEHKAIRNAAGVFDVSHMGDIRVRGTGRAGQGLAAVQYLTMNDASRLAIGQAQYSAMLYPQGTFVDDVIVHRLGEDDYLLVINAGTREKDVRWVRENIAGFECVVENLSDNYTQLAIQGPRAVDVLQKLTSADLAVVKGYWFTHGSVCGLPDILIARTGYTGEDGFEIYVHSDQATSESVWSQVLAAGREYGIVPCGLGARNTLRLEAKMALYGHEISDGINVWEAGLGRYCKMEKGDFIGRSSLARCQESALTRTLAGLEMIDRGIARDGYVVCAGSGEPIGVVTSGSPSPTLGKNIALAFVPPPLAALGTEILVEVRSQKCKAKVVATPFYRRPKKTQIPQAANSA